MSVLRTIPKDRTPPGLVLCGSRHDDLQRVDAGEMGLTYPPTTAGVPRLTNASTKPFWAGRLSRRRRCGCGGRGHFIRTESLNGDYFFLPDSIKRITPKNPIHPTISPKEIADPP